MRSESLDHHGQTVAIGTLDYTVVTVDGLRSTDDRKLYGEIEYGAQLIRLEREMRPQFGRVVLWHEIIHGIFENAGQGQDERIVDAIAHGLDQVLRDNAWLRGLYDRC